MTDLARSFPAVDVGNDVIAPGAGRQPRADDRRASPSAAGGVGRAAQPPARAVDLRQGSGRFEFTIADETFEVGPGDAFVVPSNAVHSLHGARGPGVLIDTFTPRRDDFL